MVINSTVIFINSHFGVLCLLQDLGGSCSRDKVVQSTSIFSFVTVEDVPDLDPVFIGGPYVGSVEENSPAVSVYYSLINVYPLQQQIANFFFFFYSEFDSNIHKTKFVWKSEMLWHYKSYFLPFIRTRLCYEWPPSMRTRESMTISSTPLKVAAKNVTPCYLWE